MKSRTPFALRLSRGVAFAAFAAAVASAAPASAQPEGDDEVHDQMEAAVQGRGVTQDQDLDDERARVHFRTARELYDRGEFEQAADEFELAYRLSRRPELLYNAYVAYREANDRRAAARALEQYLEASPDADDGANLERRLEELREAIAEEEAQRTELENARLRAEEEAREAALQARLAEERANQVRGPEVWPWAVLGVGGVAMVVGGVLGIIALGDANNLQSDCPDGLCPDDVLLDARRDDAQRLARIGDGLLFGGLALATAGLIFAVLYGLPSGDSDDEDGDDPEQASVQPFGICGPTGCLGGLQGSF